MPLCFQIQLRFLFNKESRQKQRNLGPIYIRLLSTISWVIRLPGLVRLKPCSLN